MNEKPIIFSGESILRILEGTKTMTRRVVKPQPTPYSGAAGLTHFIKLVHLLDTRSPHFQSLAVDYCKYGQSGDHLWVRETWSMSGNGPMYKATDPADGTVHIAWRSSMFMPRWASRITLEITAVRIEHLLDITPKDALLEGCTGRPAEGQLSSRNDGYACIEEYKRVWQEINGSKFPWESNPWVWVISFKRLPSPS